MNPLDTRPIIVAVAGPNGAGKSTFHEVFLKPVGLRFVNADVIAAELGIDAYEAAELAGRMRQALVNQRESFVFETVFSDPVGEKVAFLKTACNAGYTVLLCFIGLESALISDERVAMRVAQGGHDIPTDKLMQRYPRSLLNLRLAIEQLPYVWVYDNSDLTQPFRKVAEFVDGKRTGDVSPLPTWLTQR